MAAQTATAGEGEGAAVVQIQGEGNTVSVVRASAALKLNRLHTYKAGGPISADRIRTTTRARWT